MKKYSLILSPNTSVTTKIPIWELCIDGASVLDSFIKLIELDGTYENDLVRALSNLESAANLLLLSKKSSEKLKGRT